MTASLYGCIKLPRRPTKQRSSPPDSRQKLLTCGRQIIERNGVRGLTVRGVATRAKVNLGTFVYHFGTREAFVAEVLESWYAPDRKSVV